MNATTWNKARPPVGAGVLATPATVANRLGEFMAERHRMHLVRRAGQERPWTVDPVLHEYRFCNTYRELDTVTQWIDAHIRRPYANHPNLWFMLCIARLINWPDTLDDLINYDGAWPSGTTWSPTAMAECLRERQRTGDQVFTGAYIVPNGGRDTPKIELVAKEFLGLLWRGQSVMREAFENAETMASVHSALSTAYGWGPFLAYEVVCDARYTRYLRNASDIATWGNAGPGALRGLDRLWGRTWKGRNSSLPQYKALREMRSLLEHIDLLWPSEWPALEMREVEHALCEYDKWCRVWLKEGKPRAKYHPLDPERVLKDRTREIDRHPLLQMRAE